ncbi:MAG: hypothetical protein JWN40_4313 [Phycisphaerales bacterium]|nr:hypothetical protein [Phycisphaerales bacterium]
MTLSLYLLPPLPLGIALAIWQMRRRGLDRWLGGYVLQSRRRRAVQRGEEVHLLLCMADHFEPRWGDASDAVAEARVARWVDEYPRLFDPFRDADGRPPRHTFFYPIDQYEPAPVDSLAELCRAGFGEVEIHLHHDHDTAENLRRTLLKYKRLFAERHGLLARRRDTGEAAYGFVHGNWALDNSRPDGRWCGVNNELDVLHETGCYADFTLPSAPSPTQTRTINSIYYAAGDPARCKSHDRGTAVGTGVPSSNALMLIQGPLLLAWKHGRRGPRPAIENGCVQLGQAPTEPRLGLWLKARVGVPQRPDWFFVKLHTHGATEANQQVLLGDPMVRFHEMLARRARTDSKFHVHYVTAREMYNLARAAEAGWDGSVEAARDFELTAGTHRPSSNCHAIRIHYSATAAPSPAAVALVPAICCKSPIDSE